jgi:hypothetical protein
VSLQAILPATPSAQLRAYPIHLFRSLGTTGPSSGVKCTQSVILAARSSVWTVPADPSPMLSKPRSKVIQKGSICTLNRCPKVPDFVRGCQPSLVEKEPAGQSEHVASDDCVAPAQQKTPAHLPVLNPYSIALGQLRPN